MVRLGKARVKSVDGKKQLLNELTFILWQAIVSVENVLLVL